METDFQPFDAVRMLFGEQPYLYYGEVLLRIAIVFGLLLLVMRLLGKRGQQNLSPMQQMLTIALGSAAGDVLLYPSVALMYATVILIGVAATNIALERLALRFPQVRRHVESAPTVLVRHGSVQEDAMRHERTTRLELEGALRKAGARSLRQVELAVLEVSGEMSVFLYPDDRGGDDLVRDLLVPAHCRGTRADPPHRAAGHVHG